MIENEFYDEIITAADIRCGDLIDVASDMISFSLYSKKKGIAFNPSLLIEKIVDSVGKDGTVMIRAFNFEFCHGQQFNILSTPSRVGILGDIAGKLPQFKRTRHPLYSWWVTGRYAEKLVEMNNSKSFGNNTPFEFLERPEAKSVIIGNTKNIGLTCLHHIESEFNVDYRFEKTFTGEYVDEFGNNSTRTYSMFVRRLDRKVVFNEANAKKRLIDYNIMNECLLDGWFRVGTIKLLEAYELIRNDFSTGNFSEWTVIDKKEDIQL